MAGWIKLWRTIRTSWIIRDHDALPVWLWCLTEAPWEPKAVDWSGEVVRLQEGQILTTTRLLGTAVGMDRNKVLRQLRKLQDRGCIRLDTTPLRTVITIVNWREYQAEEASQDRAENRAETEQVPEQVPEHVTATATRGYGELPLDFRAPLRAKPEQQMRHTEEVFKKEDPHGGVETMKIQPGIAPAWEEVLRWIRLRGMEGQEGLFRKAFDSLNRSLKDGRWHWSNGRPVKDWRSELMDRVQRVRTTPGSPPSTTSDRIAIEGKLRILREKARDHIGNPAAGVADHVARQHRQAYRALLGEIRELEEVLL